LGDYL